MLGKLGPSSSRVTSCWAWSASKVASAYASATWLLAVPTQRTVHLGRLSGGNAGQRPTLAALTLKHAAAARRVRSSSCQRPAASVWWRRSGESARDIPTRLLPDGDDGSEFSRLAIPL